MNLVFFALAAALTIMVGVLLLPSLWRGARTNSFERSSVNIAVLRDQLDELERDLSNGTVSPVDYQQAKQELQRRVLEEANEKDETSSTANHSKKTALTLGIFLPLTAFVSYLILGNPEALLPQAERAPMVTRGEIEAMVASLEDKLKHSPDDPRGWAMLARSYRAFGRYEEAVNAFARAKTLVENDAQLLAEYADTLAMSRNGELSGEPTELLERALKLDPNHAFALALAGAAAAKRADYDVAIMYWEKVQAQLPPESGTALAMQESIEKARSAKRDQTQ
jgi:cytochrome c-type biogenesis protein CcmH